MTGTTNLLKLAEVGKRLTVSRHTVGELIDQGELEVIKISPRNWRVPAESVDDFLKRKCSKAEGTA